MKTITLAHSELTGTIYAIIGREKVDITDQAIAEVKAIKALEQETVSKEVYDNEHFARKEAEQKLWELQQDVSDDCVSRQAVIEYIKDCDAELMHDIENEAVREDILDMPPVTTTRKVGHWIDYWGDKTEPDGETWWSGCKCSECGIFIKAHYKYCPNCGARMESKD